MGGGVAMRAAAKVAGLSVFNSGLRGADNTVVSAARQASRSVASVVSSSSDDLKLTIANDNSNANSSVETAFDDWDFAGVEDELFQEAAEPMPRVVFGGAPTIQEAQQATHDLNDALEKTYLSPNGINGQMLMNSENVETKNCLVSETSVSKHAIQAFKFLHESPSARNVVASIASDPNVWNAVLENKEFVDFLETHKTSVVFADMDKEVNDSHVESSQESESESKPKSGKGFMDYVEDIKEKITVVEMMNTLSDTFQSLFGGSSKGEVVANPDGSAGISVEKATATGALLGLAVMVIMVVVFKRA